MIAKINFALFTTILLYVSTLSGCNSSTNSNTNKTKDTTNLRVDSLSNIKVNPLPHAKEFPGASLQISSLTSEKSGTDSAKITINYAVSNFNLTDQTEHSHHMANSHEGQHIHFILDNSPYDALYKPEHTKTVALNSEHYLLSFLSRSFHESIKTSEASKTTKFKINADGKLEELPLDNSAAIYYSRPKGEYKGDDTKSILLDFFLVNTEISSSGNKVQANINGQEFVLDKWIPYEILNLPLGESTIKLSLIDKDGKALTGDNVTVERKITLKSN